MSRFIALAVIGAVVFGVLVALRLPRLLWSFAGAALFLGAAGYAWQGRPGQPTAPAKPRVDAVPLDPEAIMLREQLMGRYTADTAYIVASDAMLRAGDKRAAAQVVLGGVRALPRSFILWTQLGSNLVMLDGDQMSPAAKLAFGRAAQLAPEHPAPPYYAGIAYVRAGDLPAARRLLARAVSLSPDGMDYRRIIANQLRVLDQYIAAMERGGR